MSNNNCTTNHAFMFFFLLSFLLVYNHAFFSSSPSKSTKSKSKSRNSSSSCNCPAAVASSAADPTTTLFLAFLSGVLFTLLCILTIRFPALFTVPIQSAVDFSSSCVRRIKSIRASPPQRQPIVHQYSSAAIGGGISASLLNSLPIFIYSGEKRHNFGKDAGLCAICLSEFVNEQTLRWLPDCDHLFHRKCIDTWLDSHKTCPCCRANVDRAGEEIALFENGEISASPEIGSSFRRLPRGDRGRDLDDRRRVGCERNVVTGLIRILMGRRRNNSNRHR